jgi:hypothetical protein
MAKKTIVRRWSKEDHRTLKTMAKDKKGANKIAKALKRTVGATRHAVEPEGSKLVDGGMGQHCVSSPQWK